MRVGLSAVLAVLLLAGCGAPAQDRPVEPARETERSPAPLPDAYKHPPK